MKGGRTSTAAPVDAALLAYCYPSQVPILEAVLKHGSHAAAAQALGVSADTVQCAMRRVRQRAAKSGYTPGSRAAARTPAETAPVASAGKPPDSGKPLTDAARHLVDLAQRGPLTLEEACNALGWPPAAVRKLADNAAAQGYAIALAGDHLGWKLPDPTDEIQETGIDPVVGEPVRVAVASDLHFGSKWCGRAQMRDFFSIVRDMGIHHVLNPGDTLDGNYDHSRYERSHDGFDAQAEDFIALWREFPELVMHKIQGNHDNTLSDSCGMEAGRALVERCRSEGLTNLHYYGSRSAFLRIGGANVHLWHPRGSGSYALSYQAQKKVESYAPGQKPDILLIGHYHRFCYINDRGVHGFQCPTFQLPGGSFGNSLRGSPDVGGMILEWWMTETGTIRRLRFERVSYYSNERPREIAP